MKGSGSWLVRASRRPRPNPLNPVIDDALKPGMTLEKMLVKLRQRAAAHDQIITDVLANGEAEWMWRGNIKTTPRAGIAHRITRIRHKLKNRTLDDRSSMDRRPLGNCGVAIDASGSDWNPPAPIPSGRLTHGR